MYTLPDLGDSCKKLLPVRAWYQASQAGQHVFFSTLTTHRCWNNSTDIERNMCSKTAYLTARSMCQCMSSVVQVCLAESLYELLVPSVRIMAPASHNAKNKSSALCPYAIRGTLIPPGGKGGGLPTSLQSWAQDSQLIDAVPQRDSDAPLMHSNSTQIWFIYRVVCVEVYALLGLRTLGQLRLPLSDEHTMMLLLFLVLHSS